MSKRTWDRVSIVVHEIWLIVSGELMMCADFEDMSCEMVYGQVPPPFEEDPVSKQPCYDSICKYYCFFFMNSEFLCSESTFEV